MHSCISLVGSKGGIGKSSICCILAGSVAKRGHSVAVIDADYNHSLANWIKKFEMPISLHQPVDKKGDLDDQRVYTLATELKEWNDLVVIDTAGAVSRAAVFAMAQSDLVIVPMMLSDADVTEAIKTFQLVDEVREETGQDIQARGLLNAYTPRTAIAGYVEQQVKELGLPMMKSKLQHLTAFKEMTHNGRVPTRWQAGQQIRWLLEEIHSLGALPFLDMSQFGPWWRKSA